MTFLTPAFKLLVFVLFSGEIQERKSTINRPLGAPWLHQDWWWHIIAGGLLQAIRSSRRAFTPTGGKEAAAEQEVKKSTSSPLTLLVWCEIHRKQNLRINSGPQLLVLIQEKKHIYQDLQRSCFLLAFQDKQTHQIKWRKQIHICHINLRRVCSEQTIAFEWTPLLHVNTSCATATKK